MTKADIVEKTAHVVDIPKRKGEIIVNAVLRCIVEALAQGERVDLRGFGSFRVSARDVPGTLAKITATVARAGANIDEVHHQRAFTTLAAQNVEVELVIQTRGPQHIADVMAALTAAGLQAQQVL